VKAAGLTLIGPSRRSTTRSGRAKMVEFLGDFNGANLLASSGNDGVPAR
jgi:hypothetical protein